MSCWDTVARGGREPRELLEAILLFNNVLDIGGPDDPLDHEDCRDLEWLGLLSDSPGGFKGIEQVQSQVLTRIRRD